MIDCDIETARANYFARKAAPECTPRRKAQERQCQLRRGGIRDPFVIVDGATDGEKAGGCPCQYAFQCCAPTPEEIERRVVDAAEAKARRDRMQARADSRNHRNQITRTT